MVKAKAAAAKVAWENLVAGNQRFVKGERAPRAFDLRREKLTRGQQPFAVVLGCSDSRVAPEVLFDKNLGEIFVVRTAGQVVEATTIASIEYAVAHLGTPLLVVLGHEQCGAVKAALEHEGDAAGNIGELLAKIHPAIAQARQQQTPEADFVETVTDLHVGQVARQLLALSPIIREAVASGSLRLMGVKYLLESGAVKVLEGEIKP